jgi:ligand-binding sensor domain-containing protein
MSRSYAEYVVHRLLLIGLANLLAAASFAQHYPILPVPGSPQGIFTMMQDSHSALWLGTIDDVVRFDGEHFYSLRSDGFPRETPNSFAEDSDGGIWVATQGTDAGGGTRRGGIYRYQAGRVVKVLAGDGLSVAAISPGLVVASVATELSGRPAFGDLILLRKSGNDWTPATLLEKQANHLTVDHQGDLLFPCPGGWCELSRQSLIDWKTPASLLKLARHTGNPLIERVLRDRFGCMWFRAEAFASYQCPTDEQPKLVPATVSQTDTSAHLEETADGSIFMLVYLALGRPGAFHIATGDSGIPEPIGTAIVARDGTIWIGAENGLYRFMYPFHLISWDSADFRMPTSIVRNGQDLLATSGEIWKLDEAHGRWGAIPGTTGLGGPLVSGPHHTLFTATDSLVLHVSSQGRVMAKSALPPVVSPDLSLAQTGTGETWLGHDGISRVVDHGNNLVLHPENVPKQSVPDIQYDSARDILWACDGNNVLFRKNGVWGKITSKDGLLDQRCFRIGIEGTGDVWVGYGANAVSWISNPASGHPVIRNYTERINRVVADGATHEIAVDRRGWLWLGNEVMRVASPDAAKAGEWLELDERDGLSPPVANGRPFQSDDDGSVWLGTRTGIAHLSLPEDFVTRFPPPPAFISGFSLGQGADILADAVTHLPESSAVVAHIGSLQFDRRSALHFRYRILPEQAAWIDTGNFDLHLPKLSWGHHALQVQAQLATGPWSEMETATLDVPKPVWLWWPSLAGYAFGLGGLLAGTRRWKRKRKARLKKAFPELAEWRLAALSPELQQLDSTLLDSRFQVGRVLARGGFAVVAEGRDLQQDGTRCAIKIFRKELVDKGWMKRRFDQEVLALGQIHHPNVVRIFGSGALPGDTLYLAMEFIDGATLREVLEASKLDPWQVGSYLRQAGRALDEIHAHSICHRDLKPENLMIRTSAVPGQELVLIDFSIAIVQDPDETLHGLSRAAGTIYYMAPEQAIGYADPSTDIYSLAKILIEMLTGKRLSTLLPDASMDLPDRVRELLSHLSLGLSSASIELIASALIFDPAHRPKNAGLFADQIADDLESSSVY